MEVASAEEEESEESEGSEEVNEEEPVGLRVSEPAKHDFLGEVRVVLLALFALRG